MKPNSNGPTQTSYDKLMLIILLAHIPVTALLIPTGFKTHAFAITASLLNGLFVIAAYALTRNTRGFRILASMALMIFSAIMIQAQMGRLEMHFHIFSALAITLIYRDWVAPAVAAAVIALHHVILTFLQLSGAAINGMPLVAFAVECSWNITFIHAAFVVMETAGLAYFAHIMNKEHKTDQALRKFINEIVEQKNLASRAPGNSHTEQLANNLGENLDTLISFLQRDNHKLITTSAEMTELSQHATTALADQRAYGERVAAASHQMASNSSEVAQHASKALSTANKIMNASSECYDLTSQSVTQVQTLNATLEELTQSIDQLRQNSVNIGSVLDVIRSISEQTNLLALNAAIEAARAGEQGRGFAVVADEVRMLAQRTQDSTNEIQEMVESLQHSTSKVVDEMHQGRELVDKSGAAISQSESSLHEITDSIDSLLKINNLVATAANEQSQASSEVSKDITLIIDAVTSLEAPTAHLRENASQLASISSQLGAQISHYKVSS